MNNYNYEFVKYNQGYEAKIFITSIEHSNLHWHYEYEFIFVMKGSVKVNAIPEPIILKEGQLILLNGKTVHEVQKTDEDNIVLFVQVSPALFQLETEEQREYFFYLNSGSQQMELEGGYAVFISRMVSLGYYAEKENTEKTARFRAKALLYSLVADCMEKLIYDVQQKASDSENSEKLNKRMLSLIHYIEENFRDEYVLESMAASLGLGEKSIHRQLKMGIGLSAKELVTECRIKEARRMLQYTNKSVSAIADSVGFNSDKTFYRVFKKHVGITPKEYREAGELINADDEIKGYLGMNWRERVQLMDKYLKEYGLSE